MKVAKTLPEEARLMLLRAAETGEPGSHERACAIDTATEKVKSLFPKFFTPQENHHETHA